GRYGVDRIARPAEQLHFRWTDGTPHDYDYWFPGYPMQCSSRPSVWIVIDANSSRPSGWTDASKGLWWNPTSDETLTSKAICQKDPQFL
ncbi:hypothetical protein AAVH_20525, partial [Aphelenchoides avenae]